MLVLKPMSSVIDMAYVFLQLQVIQAYSKTRTAEEAYLQDKEHGGQNLRILENMNNLQLYASIILQLVQYLVGDIPLKIESRV
jgi:hypothetical protein